MVQFLTLDHIGTPISNTGPYKIKIMKIRLRHVLSWPKLGLGPKFHEVGLFWWLRKSMTDKHKHKIHVL